MYKKCNACKNEFPLTNEYFGNVKKNKDGFSCICKNCIKIKTRKYYQDNKDKFSESNYIFRKSNPEYNKQYYLKNKERLDENKKIYNELHREEYTVLRKKYYESNIEKIKEYREKNKIRIKEYRKKYRIENRDKILEMKKTYYQNNIDKINAYRKLYVEKNRYKIKLYHRKRKQKTEELPINLTVDQWVYIKNKFDNKCAYCGKTTKLEQEHFIALTKGGEFSHNNIIPSCRSCNSSKGNKSFEKWYPNYKHYDKNRETFILGFLGYKNNLQQLKII